MKRLTLIAAAVLLLVSVFSTGSAIAQSDEHEPASGHEATHEFHPNFMGIFFGFTDEGRDEGFALGFDYERRLNRSFGIGFLAEHTFDLDLTVYAVPFAFHAGAWKLYAAPGIEDTEHGSESLVRLGVEYAFEVDAWEIAPQLNVDFVDNDEVYVLGVTIGKGF